MVVGDPVVVDTSALYALHSSTDEFHERAWVEYQRLSQRGQPLWIPSYALVETIALMSRRLGFEAVQLFDYWRAAHTQVLWFDERSHTEAWSLYTLNRGQGMNFVDCSVVVAAREMDAPIFTFDGGFANYGLTVVP